MVSAHPKNIRQLVVTILKKIPKEVEYTSFSTIIILEYGFVWTYVPFKSPWFICFITIWPRKIRWPIPWGSHHFQEWCSPDIVTPWSHDIPGWPPRPAEGLNCTTSPSRSSSGSGITITCNGWGWYEWVRISKVFQKKKVTIGKPGRWW